MLQMSFASQSAAVFTPKTICCRHDISCYMSWHWNLLVSLSTLQVSFASKSPHTDLLLLLLLLLLQNLYSAQIQVSSSQRRWRIARWGTWLAGVGKEVSFETAFERANGW